MLNETKTASVLTEDYYTEKSCEEISHHAILKFKDAMDTRDQLNLRLAQRITSIIRVGMFSIAIVASAMFFLMVILAVKIDPIIDAMGKMNVSFTIMANDMNKMRKIIASMDDNMNNMPTISQNVQQMGGAVQQMRDDMGSMSQRMGSMNSHIQQVEQQVGRMSHTFSSMDGAVTGISHNVHTLSKPMQPFNTMRSMMPFP